MLVVGIVGDSGSGKTTVLNLLAERGAAVIEADAIAREVVAPGSPAWHQIRQAFGSEYLTENGSLDRAALGRLIFSDEEARQQLNEITHPPMLERIEAQLQRLAAEPPAPRIVALEAAVLKEMGALELVDVVVGVRAPLPQRVARLRQRDGLPEVEARQRLRSQEQAGLAQVPAQETIDNGGSLTQTRDRVAALWQRLLARSRATNPRGSIAQKGPDRTCNQGPPVL